MQTFQIVQFVPMFKKVGNERIELDPNRLGQGQAVVRFLDGDTTRHLQRHDGRWTGWNSDRARRERAEILESHAFYQVEATEAESRLADLQAKLDDLKGKRGLDVKVERNYLREVAIKTAKAMLIVAKHDLDRAAMIAGRVDETHPEIVEFA